MDPAGFEVSLKQVVDMALVPWTMCVDEVVDAHNGREREQALRKVAFLETFLKCHTDDWSKNEALQNRRQRMGAAAQNWLVVYHSYQRPKRLHPPVSL